MAEAVLLRAPRLPALGLAAVLTTTVRRRHAGHDAVEAHQVRRARAMIRHAATRVPAYAGVLEPGDADRIRSVADLRQLPIVDKAHFLSLDPDRRAWPDQVAGGRVLVTSGTSGQPFGVPWSGGALWRNEAQRVLMMRAMRIGPLDRQVAIVMAGRARSSREVRTGRSGAARLLAGRRVELREDLPVEDIAAALLEHRPAWLTGEPHSLAVVGAALASRLQPKTVTTFGVALDSVLRAELAASYGTEVLDIYGCSEAGQVAWQCREADLYHVNHEIALLEIVGADGTPVPPGATGQLLITGLLNPLLPMVRYRIGDGAAWADRRCACGSTSPALALIAGRVLDWLVDDEDQRVPPQRLWLGAVAAEAVPFVRRYRMAQDRTGRVVVEVEPSGELAPAVCDALFRGVQKVVGATTPVEVRVVDEIVMPRGARFRQFTSERSTASTPR